MKKLPESIKYVCIAFFIYNFAVSLVVLFIPIYIRDILGNYTLTGIAISVLALTTILVDVPTGSLIDRIGRKSVLAVGFLIRAVTAFFYPIASNFYRILFVRVSDGLGTSFTWNAGWTTVRDVTRKRFESRTLAIFSSFSILACVIGSIIGGYIALRYGLITNFYLWSFFTLVALGFFLLKGKETLKKREHLKDGFKDLIEKDKIFEKGFEDLKKLGRWGIIPMLLVLLHGVNFAILKMILPLFAKALNADFFLIGVIIGTMSIPALFMYFFAKLGDKRGEGWIMKRLCLIGIIISILLAFSHDILSLFIFSLLFSLIDAGLSPNVHSLITKAIPKKHEGELTGVSEFFKHIGFFLGPILAGFLADYLWVSAPFLLASVVFFLIFLLVWK